MPCILFDLIMFAMHSLFFAQQRNFLSRVFCLTALWIWACNKACKHKNSLSTKTLLSKNWLTTSTSYFIIAVTVSPLISCLAFAQQNVLPKSFMKLEPRCVQWNIIIKPICMQNNVIFHFQSENSLAIKFCTLGHSEL